MTTKQHLMIWVCDALKDNGGTATIVQVAQYIWKHHEPDLRDSGDLFYTWQYDMRWAATELRAEGKIVPHDTIPRGTWALT